jgi:hypothetical protein
LVSRKCTERQYTYIFVSPSAREEQGDKIFTENNLHEYSSLSVHIANFVAAECQKRNTAIKVVNDTRPSLEYVQFNLTDQRQTDERMSVPLHHQARGHEDVWGNEIIILSVIDGVK